MLQWQLAPFSSNTSHMKFSRHESNMGSRDYNVVLIIHFWIMCHFFPLAQRPNAGYGLLILEVSRSHITTNHIRQDSFGRVIRSTQRPTTEMQHSPNIHAPSGIRNQSQQESGHWDRLTCRITGIIQRVVLDNAMFSNTISPCLRRG
jgi:hypothetical protein